MSLVNQGLYGRIVRSRLIREGRRGSGQKPGIQEEKHDRCGILKRKKRERERRREEEKKGLTQISEEEAGLVEACPCLSHLSVANDAETRKGRSLIHRLS